MAVRGQTIWISETQVLTWIHGEGDQTAVYAHPNVFEQVVEWKMGDPRYARKTKLAAIERGAHMQRQFTLELRVDYADADKNEVMKTAIKHALRHIYATATLLADNGIKPQVAAYSDDFFAGHEEISMLDDIIAQGITESEDSEDGGVSGELLAAAQGL